MSASFNSCTCLLELLNRMKCRNLGFKSVNSGLVRRSCIIIDGADSTVFPIFFVFPTTFTCILSNAGFCPAIESKASNLTPRLALSEV